MRVTIKNIILALALTLGASGSAVAQSAPQTNVPNSWKQIAVPSLPEFKPKQPVRIALPNGMVIFLQENHELPLINGFALIRSGSRNEPANKAGMVTLLGESWRTGGTESQTGDQLDDFLEAHAAKIESGGGNNSMTLDFDCLKADFPDVFKLFVELLQKPAFREDKLKLAQSNMKSGISRRNDDSESILAREEKYLGYGKDSPYARTPEYWTVDAVTRQDLVDFHKKYVHPNNIYFGITGDFDAKQVEAMLRSAFGSWEKGPAAEMPKIVDSPAKPGIYFARKDDVNQSEIVMIEPGIRMDSPDFYATEVFNELFGNGFSSRLFSNLRTKKGLAYAVYGGVGVRIDRTGLTALNIGTKSETTAEAIKGLNDEVEKILSNEPPTDKELQGAKDSLLNSFVFNYDTPEKVLRQRLFYEFYGYPSDFLDKYRAGLEKTTLADVRRVAERYLKPGNFITLVVGTPKTKDTDVLKQLESLGTVTKLDIEIPTESPEAKKAREAAEKAVPKAVPVATSPEAKALLAKVAEELGGMEHLRTLKNIHITGTLTVKTAKGGTALGMNSYRVLPDREAMKLATPMGEMRIVITPESTFQVMGGIAKELAEAEKAEMAEEQARIAENVLLHIDDPAYQFVIKGDDTVDGIATKVLAITLNGKTFTWYVDPANGRLLRRDSSSIKQGRPVTSSAFSSNYKVLGGLDAPTHIVIKENGEVAQTVDVTSVEYDVTNVEYNVTIDPTIFAKPAQ